METEKQQLTMKEIKELKNKINSQMNPWCYYHDDGMFRYTYEIKKDIITEISVKYIGICYCNSRIVSLDDERLTLWFNRFKYLINK